MKTYILPAADPETLQRALQILRQGGLIAMPTDTVYGLGAMAFDEQAVGKIYIAKGRSSEKAIPILLWEVDDLQKVASKIPAMAITLAGKFWPGPLTLVVPKHPTIPQAVSAGDSIGVRIPNHPVTRRILQAAGPMAVTSANLSGSQNPSTAQEVMLQLDGRIDLIVDAGPVGAGLASTVVNCLGSEPVILREGPISFEQIKQVLGI